MKKEKKQAIGVAIAGLAIMIFSIIVFPKVPVIAIILFFLGLGLIAWACYLLEQVMKANQTEN